MEIFCIVTTCMTTIVVMFLFWSMVALGKRADAIRDKLLQQAQDTKE